MLDGFRRLHLCGMTVAYSTLLLHFMSENEITVDMTSTPTASGQSGPRDQTRSAATAGRKAGRGIDLASLIVVIVVVLAVGVAAFFVYRGSSLKSQLRQARNDVQQQRARLQLRIDSAAAKARESAGQVARLQSELDLAKTAAASASANAEQASNRVAELQTQLTQAKGHAAEAEANAKKASAEVAKLKSLLQTRVQAEAPAMQEPAQAESPAPLQPAASGLKRLPLDVSFQKAPMLDGNALALKNTSSAILSVTLRFSNRSESKEIPVTLDPGAVKELGWLGDWVLASGDKVEIRSAGYQAIVKRAP